MTGFAGAATRFRIDGRMAELAIAVLAVVASITGIANGFALDDVHIIARNEAVHSWRNVWSLFDQTYWPPEYGASLYRPLTSVAFAFQWAIGGGSPLVFHVVSIVLYAAVSVAVLRLAQRFMSSEAALAGSALFAVHPVHVEAVANIVGQAELWAALLVVSALSLYVRMRETRSRRDLASLGVLYGGAMMFKENAIVLPGMMLAAELILPARDPVAHRARRVWPALVVLGIVAAAFLTLRTSVIGKFTGGSTATVLAGQSYETRFYTMLNVVPEWLRLFVWPASLSADYSPPRVATATGFELSMIAPLLVIVCVAVIVLVARRRHPALSLALALTWLALLIPSNLVVVTGFALAERTLFLPSVGFALAVGCGVGALWRGSAGSSRQLMGMVSAMLLIAGIVRSSLRNPVWKDNETLFRQMVVDVPTSYRAHFYLGELLTDKGEAAEGLAELERAVALAGPRDYYVRWFAADRFHAAGQLGTAIRYYKDALRLKPSDERVRYGAAMALKSNGQKTEARALATEGLTRHPQDVRFARIVSEIDSTGATRPGA